jgi:hypothetical protein
MGLVSSLQGKLSTKLESRRAPRYQLLNRFVDPTERQRFTLLKD